MWAGSFEFQANHALTMITRWQVHRGSAHLWLHGPFRPPCYRHCRSYRYGAGHIHQQYGRPAGLTLIGNYAMVKARHLFQYGTTNEQFAHISVATRRHAMRTRKR